MRTTNVEEAMSKMKSSVFAFLIVAAGCGDGTPVGTNAQALGDRPTVDVLPSIKSDHRSMALSLISRSERKIFCKSIAFDVLINDFQHCPELPAPLRPSIEVKDLEFAPAEEKDFSDRTDGAVGQKLGGALLDELTRVRRNQGFMEDL